MANGKGEPILGKGKIRLMCDNVESTALYVPTFHSNCCPWEISQTH